MTTSDSPTLVALACFAHRVKSAPTQFPGLLSPTCSSVHCVAGSPLTCTSCCCCCLTTLPAVVTSRPDPLGSTVGNVEQLLCPPDTFVRTLDGRADAMGLYYLVLICSDGTFIGSVGFLGLGGSTPGDIFVASTPTDGWAALTAGLVNNAVVSLSLTSTEGDTTPTYGNSTAQRANRSCQTGERLVGVDVYPSGRIGDLGGIQMLCGESPGYFGHALTIAS